MAPKLGVRKGCQPGHPPHGQWFCSAPGGGHTGTAWGGAGRGALLTSCRAIWPQSHMEKEPRIPQRSGSGWASRNTAPSSQGIPTEGNARVAETAQGTWPGRGGLGGPPGGLRVSPGNRGDRPTGRAEAEEGRWLPLTPSHKSTAGPGPAGPGAEQRWAGRLCCCPRRRRELAHAHACFRQAGRPTRPAQTRLNKTQKGSSDQIQQEADSGCSRGSW